MAAGVTYTPIESKILGTAVSTVTFSSISGSYTDLILVMNVKGSTTNYCQLRFNSDTGNSYSRSTLSGDGSSATSGRQSSVSIINLDSYASNSSSEFNKNIIVQIQNYSNSTTYKTLLARANNAADGVDAIVGLWRSTSAITTINLLLNTGDFATGSTFTLYGIAAA